MASPTQGKGGAWQPDQIQGQNAQNSTINYQTPMQQDFFKNALGQAQNLYEQGMPEYYQGQTVAGFNPAQMEAMNNTTNYMGGQYNQLQGNTFDALNQGLSGNIDTRGFDDMSAMYQDQAMQGANDMMKGLRSNQVSSGQHGGSSRGDIMNNQVIDNASNQYSNNMAGMYNNAYQTAQDNRMQSMGMANSIMSNPMQMNQAFYNQVGLPQQQMNQATMNDAKDRYDYGARSPYENLSQYMNFISGNMGGSSGTANYNKGK